MNNNKLYVLTSREGTSIHKPQVFINKQDAFNQMKIEFDNILQGYEDSDCVESNGIEESEATIITGGDWLEWFINECVVNK